MTFGGSMYSANAANRSLIINGQIHRENDLVTPDLSIEQIRVKGAVFRFKGYRVEVPY
jgi:general secretion pathway protein B